MSFLRNKILHPPTHPNIITDVQPINWAVAITYKYSISKAPQHLLQKLQVLFLCPLMAFYRFVLLQIGFNLLPNYATLYQQQTKLLHISLILLRIGFIPLGVGFNLLRIGFIPHRIGFNLLWQQTTQVQLGFNLLQIGIVSLSIGVHLLWCGFLPLWRGVVPQ